MGLVGSDWEQRAVAELDSAMNEFLGGLPDHREGQFLDSHFFWLTFVVRWDPNRTGVFFDQSAVLHAMYYNLQITVRLSRPRV